MRARDEPGEVGALLGIGTVKLTDRPDDAVDELVVHLTLDEHVVGRDARLAGIEELAPRDSFRGHREVGVAADNRGALAAQFERDRGEVLGRGLHHNAGHPRVAGVDDVIETLREQLGGFCDAAANNGDRWFVECVEQFGEGLFGRGRKFRRFGDHGVSCRNRLHYRQNE